MHIFGRPLEISEIVAKIDAVDEPRGACVAVVDLAALALTVEPPDARRRFRAQVWTGSRSFDRIAPRAFRSGVAGFAGQLAEVDAELADRALHLCSRSASNTMASSDGDDSQPLAWISGIELARAPSRHSRAPACCGRGPPPAAISRRMSMVAVSATLSPTTQRVVLHIVGRMQHEAAAGLDRPAEIDRMASLRVLRPILSCCSRSGKVKELHRLLTTRPIAPSAVGAHIDDRAREARIPHLRHGDQQLAREIAARGRSVAMEPHIVCWAQRGKVPRPDIRNGIGPTGA